MSGVLEGLRVVDLSTGIPAGFAARLLADNGADVIKVESPSGDVLRQDIYDFVYCNMGKRSVALDLEDGDARAALDVVLDRADVVIESCDAVGRERYGLDPDRLRAGRETLIVISVTPFGGSGPYRDWRASEHVLYGMGHEMYATGQPDLPPGPLAPYVSWLTIGFSAAVVTLAAMYGVANGQGGSHYDISGFEAMAASIDRRAHALVAYAYCGDPLTRGGTPEMFPPHANPCADGWVSVAAGGLWWEPFCRVVGLPELAEFRTAPAVGTVPEDVHAAWRNWCSTRTKREISDLFQSAGVPSEPMNTMADLLRDDHLRSRSFFKGVDVDDSAGMVPGPIVRLGGPEPDAWPAAPRLGEHTIEVLREAGVDEQWIARLTAQEATA
ncbi:CaiB/BaiF CoA transferase family protein [Acrocarpospora macrocephala]|uniref:CaiB/BaiF CoA transferase family protein n=1 Tax=Acrocarpospora macrocephala TaxID=150177 RepID=UPI0012D34A56|nr:CoA transferase [Acrocarpospora macrocephala]